MMPSYVGLPISQHGLLGLWPMVAAGAALMDSEGCRRRKVPQQDICELCQQRLLYLRPWKHWATQLSAAHARHGLCY